MDRVKRIWYLSPMRAAKVQASLRIRAVSPEPSLLAHTSSESRGTFRQKARSLAPLNGWACAVKLCHECSKTQIRLTGLISYMPSLWPFALQLFRVLQISAPSWLIVCTERLKCSKFSVCLKYTSFNDKNKKATLI